MRCGGGASLRDPGRGVWALRPPGGAAPVGCVHVGAVPHGELHLKRMSRVVRVRVGVGVGTKVGRGAGWCELYLREGRGVSD